MFDFWRKKIGREAFDSVCKRPPYEILVFLINSIFFRQNEITLWDKKRTALFQTHNWEKSKEIRLKTQNTKLKEKNYVDQVNYAVSETTVWYDDVDKDDKGDWGERGDRTESGK